MLYLFLVSSQSPKIQLKSLSVPTVLDVENGGILETIKTPKVFSWNSSTLYVVSEESRSILEDSFNSLPDRIKQNYNISFSDLPSALSNLYSSTERNDAAVSNVSVVDIQKGVLKSGITTVTTAGIAVRLVSASTPVKTPITLIWHPDNTGRIYPGPATVANNLAGAYLDSSIKTLVLDVANLDEIYVNADNDGDKVLYIAS